MDVKHIYCNNCGIKGHLYKDCRKPVISCGNIIFRLDKDEPEILMIQRKDSLCYIEFLRGKYDIYNINYTLKLSPNDGKYIMGRTILFLVFVTMTISGGWLVWRRTGNYDIDFFTKILGWILLIPGILGIMESLKMLQ